MIESVFSADHFSFRVELRDAINIGHAFTNFDIQVVRDFRILSISDTEERHQVLNSLLILLMHVELLHDRTSIVVTYDA